MAVLEASIDRSSQKKPAAAPTSGRGQQIRFTIGDSPLGRLLIAGTTHGVRAVCIADADDSLREALQMEFPAAEVVRDDVALRAWWRALLANLNGAQPQTQLPLDVRGTPFQWRVWQELCKIPWGGTRSYTAVATALGQPSAARAVARACATNPVALLIPCHRVIRENGDLAGYRWGIARKRALLAAERP